MSQHDDGVSLRQMLDHAREALEPGAGKPFEDLERNRLLQLALTRLAEVLGEAASRVSKPTRLRYPSLPWQQLVGMRNRLIHGYDVLDLKILWDTVNDDLPLLIPELERVCAANVERPNA